MASYSHRQNAGGGQARWPFLRRNLFRRIASPRSQGRPTTIERARRSLLRNLWGLLVMLAALVAFELFNFSTTEYALSTFFGQHSSLGLASWATVLAIACCGIDFAGLARLFTREVGNEPREVWLLTGAWFLGALMNAVMTWWAVASALSENPLLGNELVSREQVLQIVPVFVAGLVWLTRVMLIGAIGIAGDRLLSQFRQKWGEVKARAAQSYRAAQSGHSLRRAVDTRPAQPQPRAASSYRAEPLPASQPARSLLGGPSPAREAQSHRAEAQSHRAEAQSHRAVPPRTYPEMAGSRPAAPEYPRAYTRETGRETAPEPHLRPAAQTAQPPLFAEAERSRPVYASSAPGGISGGSSGGGTSRSGSRASTVSTVTSRPAPPRGEAGRAAYRPEARPAPPPPSRPAPCDEQESFDDDELVYEDLE